MSHYRCFLVFDGVLQTTRTSFCIFCGVAIVCTCILWCSGSLDSMYRDADHTAHVLTDNEPLSYIRDLTSGILV